MINSLLAGFVRCQDPSTGLDGFGGASTERLQREGWVAGTAGRATDPAGLCFHTG